MDAAPCIILVVLGLVVVVVASGSDLCICKTNNELPPGSDGKRSTVCYDFDGFLAYNDIFLAKLATGQAVVLPTDRVHIGFGYDCSESYVTVKFQKGMTDRGERFLLESQTNSDGSHTVGGSIDTPIGSIGGSVDIGKNGKITGGAGELTVAAPVGPEVGIHGGVHNGHVNVGGKVGVNAGGLAHVGVQGDLNPNDKDKGSVGVYSEVGKEGIAGVSSHAEIHSDGHGSAGVEGQLGPIKAGVDTDQHTGTSSHIGTGISGSSSGSHSDHNSHTSNHDSHSSTHDNHGSGSTHDSHSTTHDSHSSHHDSHTSSSHSRPGGFDPQTLYQQVGVADFMKMMYAHGR